MKNKINNLTQQEVLKFIFNIWLTGIRIYCRVMQLKALLSGFACNSWQRVHLKVYAQSDCFSLLSEYNVNLVLFLYFSFQIGIQESKIQQNYFCLIWLYIWLLCVINIMNFFVFYEFFYLISSWWQRFNHVSFTPKAPKHFSTLCCFHSVLRHWFTLCIRTILPFMLFTNTYIKSMKN